MSLKTTPLHPRTAALSQGQQWRRWSGYLAAGAYELQPDREYAAIRNSAALFDVSPLYKYRVEGRDAERLLDRVVPRDVRRCAVGQVLYTPWCDARGKVLDDGTVQRLGERRFRMTCALPGLTWLERNAMGMEVSIVDETDAVAALALQGPAARHILRRVVDADLDGLKFFHLLPAPVAGVPAEISRTGYTGDLGYEIWMRSDDALTVWDGLIAAGEPYGITPAGILALDVARIEAGLLMLEVDYVSSRHALIEAQTSTPYELDLGWAVRLDKGPFVGREALRRARAAGTASRFIAIDVLWDSLEGLYAEVGLPPQLPRVAWRGSVPLYAGVTQVGYATSGCWSPILKQYLALAHVDTTHADPGCPVEMEINVEHRPRRAQARVIAKPAFDPERKRS